MSAVEKIKQVFGDFDVVTFLEQHNVKYDEWLKSQIFQLLTAVEKNVLKILGDHIFMEDLMNCMVKKVTKRKDGKIIIYLTDLVGQEYGRLTLEDDFGLDLKLTQNIALQKYPNKKERKFVVVEHKKLRELADLLKNLKEKWFDPEHYSDEAIRQEIEDLEKKFVELLDTKKETKP